MILRLATTFDANIIWEILQAAILQRKIDGSTQWQNGYPNEETVAIDIQQGYGYVLEENNIIIAYAAIVFGDEPTYQVIKGAWLSNQPYVVVHRVATAPALKGKGIATELFLRIEKLALEKNVLSIKVDTNFDNIPMLKIMDNLNYTYCGEIFVSGFPRRAYEKLLMPLN
jgi:GNAT superfamily N-acetyltransferase